MDNTKILDIHVNGKNVLKICLENTEQAEMLINSLEPMAASKKDINCIQSFSDIPFDDGTRKEAISELCKDWTELQKQSISTIFALGFYGQDGRNEAIVERLKAGDKSALLDDLEMTWEMVYTWSDTIPYGKLYWLIEKSARHCIKTLQTGLKMISDYYFDLLKEY